MKKIILSLICIISTIQLYAQNIELKGKFYPDMDTDFNFEYLDFVSDTEIVMKVLSDSGNEEFSKLEYSIGHINGISCIILKEPFGENIMKNAYKKLYNQSLIKTGNVIPFIYCEYDFYDLDNRKWHNRIVYANIMNAYPNRMMDNISGSHASANYRSSSHLTEGTVVYSVENLSFDHLITPWVEGVPGNGIGEYIEIYENSYLPGDKYLMIMNGYFSTDKPYLYKQNNRIKTIKITGLHSKKEKILEVLDTPHPQTVDISFLEMIDKAVDWDTEPIQVLEDFRITIMDIYKGTKYDDTCINCLMPWSCEVTPYEDSIGE